MLELTFIGTSALMPLPQRALCSVLLKVDGRSVLFDCGEGTQSAAKKAGVSLMKTDLIALSHYHGDHIFGLPGLLQTMNVMKRETQLTITGPGDVEKELAPIMALVGEVDYEIRLISVPEEGLALARLGFSPYAVLEAFATEHRVTSCGYRFSLSRPGKFQPEKAKELGVPMSIWNGLQKGEPFVIDGTIIEPEDVMGEDRKGLSVVYSGDTARCETLTAHAKDADVLICEATFGENEQQPLADERGHMTFRDAALTAKAADVDRLILTHFSPRVVEPSEYLSNATEIFEKTMIAFDGMQMELNFEKRA